MNVKKGIITAAGPSRRTLPLQTLVDRDGVEKRALQIILEEAVAPGVEDLCVVVVPGDQDAYREAAGDYAGHVHFVEQARPLGYGHALWLGRDFAGGQAVLHLVSDHLYISRSAAKCTQQVVEQARAEGCSVSAVQATRESMLPLYGAMGGRRVSGRTDLYEVENVLEKPTPSTAEQELIVPGLRAGHYLCMFGIHVFTPALMDGLDEIVRGSTEEGSAQLSIALARHARRGRYLAMEVQGTRHNIGIRYGLLNAQLALALDGADRDSVLAHLVELLAFRGRNAT